MTIILRYVCDICMKPLAKRPKENMWGQGVCPSCARSKSQEMPAR